MDEELTKLKMLASRFSVVMQLRDTFVAGAEQIGTGLTSVLTGAFLMFSALVFFLPAFIYELLKPTPKP